MSNDDVYAAGLLNRALDPSTQPVEIRTFLQAEIALLDGIIVRGASVIDVGCGTGRHLACSASVSASELVWTTSTPTSWRPIGTLVQDTCTS